MKWLYLLLYVLISIKSLSFNLIKKSSAAHVLFCLSFALVSMAVQATKFYFSFCPIRKNGRLPRSRLLGLKAISRQYALLFSSRRRLLELTKSLSSVSTMIGSCPSRFESIGVLNEFTWDHDSDFARVWQVLYILQSFVLIKTLF